MKSHKLKTVNPYFQELWLGRKKFEVRKNDRDYKEGDTLVLLEYYADSEKYSGRAVYAIVHYVFYGGNYGVQDGYCIMSIEPIDKAHHEKERLL